MKRVVVGSLLFFGFLVIAKVICATDLALFGDEAFYFQCARRLDIAFSDHPFMTAAFVRAGLELLGPTTLATRLLFQLVGFAFPFIVYWLARPHVGRDRAFLAASASIVVPATAWLGVLAIPDAPHMLFAALALGLFDRALRSQRPVTFVLAGLVTAAGLATHLRFVLVPFAFFLHLVLTREGRACWKRFGIWLYALVAVPGFLPVLLFNARLDFRPLKFQGEERHAGGASLDGFLEHIPLQLVACTPLLYVALIATLCVLLARARRGNPTAALFAAFSLAHLGVFLATSPIADTSHATIHWPAPGYVPLLVFLPGVLLDFVARKPTPWRRRVAIATPLFGAIVLFLAFLELSIHPFGIMALQKPFKGYAEAAERVAAELEVRKDSLGVPPLVVADHYILGGNLEQQLLARGIAIDLFVLDHEKNHEHGRALQYELWGMDELSLGRDRAGHDALVIAEKNQSRSGTSRPQSWVRWEPHIGELFRTVEALPGLVIESGGKEPRDFRIWIGHDVKAR